MLEKGLIQLYTGSGKGKTTAALGLGLRAAGAGMKTDIYQFLKPPELQISERQAVRKYNLPIRIIALDLQWNMRTGFDDPENVRQTAEKISLYCNEISQIVANPSADVIILDELAYCHAHELATIEDIKTILDKRAASLEIIITGRDAKQELIELADLVSEIRPIKHPYEKNITARKGIEF